MRKFTQETLASHMEKIFQEEIMKLRGQGQKEYAHDDSSPFANFDRGAADLRLDRKQILWVYAMKHKDGISSFLQGHTSQREDVRGRINDLIVYLFLLRGMVDEELEKGIVENTSGPVTGKRMLTFPHKRSSLCTCQSCEAWRNEQAGRRKGWNG